MTAPTAPAPRLGAATAVVDALRHCPGHRARLYATLAAILTLSAVVTVIVLAATGLVVSTGDFGRLIGLSLGMMALALFCHVRHDDKRLGETAAIVGLLTISLILCGILSNAGLRLGMPLLDPSLARADAMVGIHVDQLISAVARWPNVPSLLRTIYYSAGPAFLALLGWHLFRNQSDRAWALAATTAISTQLVAVVSIFTPARGAMVHYGLAGIEGLPMGSGTYFTEAFDRYYFQGETILSLDRMNGVVAFPSFHAVLALVIAQGFHATRLRGLGYLWAAAITVSAVPIGGHYVADLLGGALVWLGAWLLVDRVMTPRGMPNEAARALPAA
jgi:hypothetical protein